jgi:hypothetical protein
LSDVFVLISLGKRIRELLLSVPSSLLRFAAKLSVWTCFSAEVLCKGLSASFCSEVLHSFLYPPSSLLGFTTAS